MNRDDVEPTVGVVAGDSGAAVSEPRRPTLLEALLPLLAMGVLLAVGYGWLGYRIEVLLIAAAAVAGGVARHVGYSWKDMEEGVVSSMAKAMPAVMILITVGALIATWIAAGTIPLLVYYGLELISARFFLFTACVICSVVSVATGTMAGAAGTVGVALMGVAEGLGVPAGAAAGAVVAGASFGDKLSPLSDTTNLAPVVAGSNLFDHIRWMLWTTAPAWILGLLVYLVVGLGTETAATPEVGPIQDALKGSFRFHLALLLPLAVILWFAFRKLPILPGMLLASLVAGILAVVFQGESVGAVIEAVVTGYVSGTGVESVDSLLSRGGMHSMMQLVLIVIAAFGFGGIMNRCGLLPRVLDALMTVVKGVFGLVASTVATGIVTAVVTGSAYLSIIVSGDLFREAYREQGLAAKNLSRTTEDSGTVVVPLVPWSFAGVFMAGVLGVPTMVYAPWAVLNYTGFLFALFYGATGIGIAKRVREDETIPGS